MYLECVSNSYTTQCEKTFNPFLKCSVFILKIVSGHFHCNPGISSTHKLSFIIICTTHKVSSASHTTQHNSAEIIFIIEQINLLHLLTIMILSTLLAIIKVTEINLEMHSLHCTEAPHNIVYWQAQISSQI